MLRDARTLAFAFSAASLLGIYGCSSGGDAGTGLLDGSALDGSVADANVVDGNVSGRDATVEAGPLDASRGDADASSADASTGDADAAPVCMGGAMACQGASDCPMPAGECVVRTCTAGCCGTSNVAVNTVTTAGQTANDCQKTVCDGSGFTKSIADDDDKPTASDDCHVGACNAGVPAQTRRAKGTTCTSGGGKVCDDTGSCVACNVDTDCTNSATPRCQAGTCVAATCTDGVKNGSETDQDCGGTCSPCAVGKICGGSNDCTTGVCNGTCAYKAQGSACTGAGQCGPAGSDFCTDGVCCATACNGTCEACSASKKGSGADGTCGAIAAASDPDAECTDDGAGSCGHTGSCNGAGACDTYAAGTTCRGASGVCDVAETCTGTGADCPADGFITNTTVCRSSAGSCDIAETCTGTTAACPVDAFLPNVTVCRASSGVCDTAEICTGTTAECPADVFLPNIVTCRAASGVCDVAENCTGTTAACPANGFRPNGFTPAALQTPGDCQKIICVGTNATSVTSANDVTDVPVSTSRCLVNARCDVAGGPATPTFDPAATGTNCSSDPGPGIVCGNSSNPVIAGTCVDCNSDADCLSINDAGVLTCNTSTGTCE
ncbi:MAG: hypothetical protein U0169_04475 [Polyangiaceae bacterium]